MAADPFDEYYSSKKLPEATSSATAKSSDLFEEYYSSKKETSATQQQDKPTGSSLHAGVRAAGEAVAPGFGGLTGAVYGAKTMLPYALQAAALVPHPVAKAAIIGSLELLGAGAGGFVGAEGIGWAQDKLHQLIDPKDYTARKAEREQYPTETMVGGVVGGAVGLSPKVAIVPAAKFITTAMRARGLSAAGQMGVSAGTQYATKGEVDLGETALAGATGFALPGVNPLGRPFAALGERLAGKGAAAKPVTKDSTLPDRPTPEATPEEHAAYETALKAELEKRTADRAAKSPLKQTAIRNKETGEIELMGPKHDQARKDATKDTHDEGFVDDNGIFHERMDAVDQAKRAGQIPEDHVLESPEGERPGLHSGDLRKAGVKDFEVTAKKPDAVPKTRQEFKDDINKAEERLALDLEIDRVEAVRLGDTEGLREIEEEQTKLASEVEQMRKDMPAVKFARPMKPTSEELHDFLWDAKDVGQAFDRILATPDVGNTTHRLLMRALNKSNFVRSAKLDLTTEQLTYTHKSGRVQDAAAFYHQDDHRVQMGKQSALRALMHEAMHSATFRLLEEGTSSSAIRMKELYKDYEEVQNQQYDKALAQFKKDNIAPTIRELADFDKNYRRLYGFTDVHEFVSETFTNREFQELLSGYDVRADKTRTTTNYFDEFKNILADYFGVSKEARSALDDVIDIGKKLVDESKDFTESKPQYATTSTSVPSVIDFGKFKQDKKSEETKKRAKETMEGMSEEDYNTLQNDVYTGTPKSIIPSSVKEYFSDWLTDSYGKQGSEEAMSPERVGDTQRTFLEEMIGHGEDVWSKQELQQMKAALDGTNKPISVLSKAKAYEKAKKDMEDLIDKTPGLRELDTNIRQINGFLRELQELPYSEQNTPANKTIRMRLEREKTSILEAFEKYPEAVITKMDDLYQSIKESKPPENGTNKPKLVLVPSKIDTEKLAEKTTPEVAKEAEKVDPRSVPNKEEMIKHATDIHEKYGPEEAKKFFQEWNKDQKERSIPVPKDEQSLDDALHKIDTFQTADKSEHVTEYLENSADGITPAMREESFIGRELGVKTEGKLGETLDKLDSDNKALVRKIKGMGGDVGEEFVTGQSRIRIRGGGVTSNWKEMLKELFANRTPLGEKVADQANAAMERTVYQLDDGRVIELHRQSKNAEVQIKDKDGKVTGTRKITKGTEVWEWKDNKKKMIYHTDNLEFKRGDKFSLGGKEHTVVDAKVPSIEEHSPYKYLKDSEASARLANMALRKMSRDLELINNLKQSDLFKRVAHGPDDALKDLPAGWKVPENIDKIPQLRGYHFDPKTAAIIEDFAKVWDNTMWMKLSNQVVKNMMLNPVPHMFNEVMHLFNARGFTGWVPLTGGWSRLGSSGAKAWRDVSQQTSFYRDVARAGGSVLGADPRNNYFEEMQKHATKQYLETPENEGNMKILAKKLGTSVGDLYNGISKASQKAMWFTRDVMYFQYLHEVMDRHEKRTGTKMSTEDGVKEVERHMPNYRMGPEVLGSRGLAKVLKNPNIAMFSRYHYGMVKSLVNTMKDMNPQNLKSVEGRRHFRDGVDSMLAIGVAMAAIYPMMDSLAQVLFGEGAEQRRAGPYHLIQAGKQVLSGERDASALIWPVFTFNPMLLTLGQAAFNKNIFTGKPIYHPDDPVGDIASDIGSYAAKQIPQVPSLMGAVQEDGGEGKFIAKQLDIKVKTEKQREAERTARKREAAAAKGRIKKREQGTYRP